MRLPCIAALGLAFGLASCASGGSFGEAATGFVAPQIAQAYMPLQTRDWMLTTHYGAAVVIAPGIAVTNAHNANLVPTSSVIGMVDGYDLLFFRVPKSGMLQTSVPTDGEAVLAYGQGADGGLRVSHGVVRRLWPAAFGFVSDAGTGFSGGPVVDAATGRLLGITYGFNDRDPSGGRLMVAYTMSFVAAELAKMQAKTGS